jgi:hypothetical protein
MLATFEHEESRLQAVSIRELTSRRYRGDAFQLNVGSG